MSSMGLVSGLFRYPVKSMQGEELNTLILDDAGVVGDRRFGVVDAASGKVISAKREPRLLEASARYVGGEVRPQINLPDGNALDGGLDGAELDEALSAWLDRDVSLDEAVSAHGRAYEMSFNVDDPDDSVFSVPMPPDRFVDLSPIHLLTTSSIAAAADAHDTGEWDVARFRPNVFLTTDDSGFIEDGWVGNEVTIGETVLMIRLRTVRCIVTTRGQPSHGLRRDLEIFKTIRDTNQSNLGVYATVARGGVIAVGDSVTLD